MWPDYHIRNKIIRFYLFRDFPCELLRSYFNHIFINFWYFEVAFFFFLKCRTFQYLANQSANIGNHLRISCWLEFPSLPSSCVFFLEILENVHNTAFKSRKWTSMHCDHLTLRYPVTPVPWQEHAVSILRCISWSPLGCSSHQAPLKIIDQWFCRMA